MVKTIQWNRITIPDKDCFVWDKKCTPECPSYDIGNLYFDDEDDES